MKCAACDGNMSNLDTSRKSPVTGRYYDLCKRCFETIKDQVEWTENPRFSEEEDYGEDSEQNKDKQVSGETGTS